MKLPKKLAVLVGAAGAALIMTFAAAEPASACGWRHGVCGCGAAVNYYRPVRHYRPVRFYRPVHFYRPVRYYRPWRHHHRWHHRW